MHLSFLVEVSSCVVQKLLTLYTYHWFIGKKNKTGSCTRIIELVSWMWSRTWYTEKFKQVIWWAHEVKMNPMQPILARIFGNYHPRSVNHYGDLGEVMRMHGVDSHGEINTAYVDRLNLTIRNSLVWSVCKSMNYSWILGRYTHVLDIFPGLVTLPSLTTCFGG
jgi:hypothetical protein